MDNIGDISTSLDTSLIVINSSKCISNRVTCVLSSESAGSTASSLGGVTSFLPPAGGTILAHPVLKQIMNNNKINDTECRMLIAPKNKPKLNSWQTIIRNYRNCFLLIP